MKANLHCYKIYGSSESYSGKEFEMPSETPIVIDEFLQRNITIKLHIGNISNELKDAVIINQALANDNPLIPSDTPRLKGDELISLALEQNRTKNIFTNKRWLLAIEAIVEIEVPEKKLPNMGKHFWLDVNYARETWKEYQSLLKSSFDNVMGFVIPYIGEEFVDSLIANHYYYESIHNDYGYFTFPEYSASCRMWSQQSIESIDIATINKILVKLKDQPKKLKFINTVRHWYLNTVNETDQWKVFLWSFWGLEVLSKKYQDRYYDKIKGDTPTEQGLISDGHSFEAHVLQSLLPEKNRVPLIASFAIMSTILNPNDSSSDTKHFKKLVKLRNSLSHGQAIDDSQLPAHQIQQLFHKYYKLAIDDMLKNA